VECTTNVMKPAICRTLYNKQEQNQVDMFDRLNTLVCTVSQGNLMCLIKVPGMLSDFASFNVHYNPVRFLYEKKQLAFNF